MQVALLSTPATADARKWARAAETEDDWLELAHRELYWWPRGGLSQSELDIKPLAKALGTVTIRTQSTIARMLAKRFS